MKALRRLWPYIAAYRLRVGAGLLLVVVGAGATSLIPWLLRAGIDDLRSGAPRSHVLNIGAAMVGVALISGMLRYIMRELLNGVSRFVEFDLRNDALPRFPGRTHEQRAFHSNSPGRVWS